MVKIILCKNCDLKKAHYGKELCVTCYKIKWYWDNIEEARKGARECAKKHSKERYIALKRWREKNVEKRRQQGRRQYWKDPEKARAGRMDWRMKNLEKARNILRNWQKKNPEKRRINNNKYLKKYPLVRLSCYFGYQIYFALKHNKAGRHWEEVVGYTLNDLQQHLEKQFTKKMSWDNYGRYWHVDHRIPKSKFIFKFHTDKGFIECWALDNLQPKIGIDNKRKGDRYSEPTLNNFFILQKLRGINTLEVIL